MLKQHVTNWSWLRFPVTVIALALTLSLTASARETYVDDAAGMLSPAAISKLNRTIASFAAVTGKEVFVVSVPSLNGQAPQEAAEKAFAQHQVNGVLVFLSKADKKWGIVPDRASAVVFRRSEIESIRAAMHGYLLTGDFDTGVTTGVDLVIDQFRARPTPFLSPSATPPQRPSPTPSPSPPLSPTPSFSPLRAPSRTVPAPRPSHHPNVVQRTATHAFHLPPLLYWIAIIVGALLLRPFLIAAFTSKSVANDSERTKPVDPGARLRTISGVVVGAIGVVNAIFDLVKNIRDTFMHGSGP